MPTLLVLYLLKLRRRPLRVGSILFWPKASDDAQVNVPFRWLSPSWLLLLHLLALACLLLALARPTIDSEDGASERVVLLLDTSASMGTIDTLPESGTPPRETRLDRAKARAAELVRQLRADNRRSICVASFAASAQTLSAFTPSASIAQDAISSVSQTDQPANLPAALMLVESLTADATTQASAETQSPPTVILLSDGSFPADEDNLSTSLRLRYERIGPPAAVDGGSSREQSSTPTRTPASDNIGIANIAARRDDTNPSLVRLFARVVSNNATALDVPLSLAIEGVVTSRRAVRVRAATPDDAAGEQQVVFEVPASPKGVLTVMIDRPDSLASDNIASLVLPDQFKPVVTVVTRDADNAATLPAISRDFTWLITDVLDELGCERVNRRSISEYESERRISTTAPLPHLTIFVGTSPSAPPASPSLHFGGGTPLPPLQFANDDASANVITPSTSSIFWDRLHPLMRGVPLDSLIVRKALALRVADSGESSQPTSQTQPASVLARSNDTPLIALISDNSIERIFIGFDLIDSNWPLQPGFAVFLANVVDRLTPRARSFVGQSFTTGESIVIRAQGRESISLSGPADILVREGGSINPTLTSPDAVQSVSAGLVAKAGVYIVKGAGERGDRAVAVNIANQLESMALAPMQVQLGTKEMNVFESGANTRELWREFLLAAGLMLSIEWLVYGWQVRK